MKVSVKISDHEVHAALQKLLSKVGNLRPAMEKIGLMYAARVQQNFDDQRAPDGTPWQRLSETTLTMKLFGERKGKDGSVSRPYLTKRRGLNAKGRSYLQGKKILIESGDLRDTVHHQATATSVTIGSNKKYAAIHQFGGLAGRGRKTKIPARPWLAMNKGTELELADRDKKMVLDIIEEHMK